MQDTSYRRALRLAYQPLGRVRSASEGILHTRSIVIVVTRTKIKPLKSGSLLFDYISLCMLYCYVDIRYIPLFARETRVRR